MNAIKRCDWSNRTNLPPAGARCELGGCAGGGGGVARKARKVAAEQANQINSQQKKVGGLCDINIYSRTEPTRPDPPKKHHTNASFGCKVKWARCPESCCVEQANP